MSGMLPPVIIDVIGQDRDLLSTLADARAALAAFAATPTDVKIGVDASGLNVAMVAAINQALRDWQSPLDKLKAEIESDTWYAGVGIEIRNAQVVAELAKLDAMIATARMGVAEQGLGDALVGSLAGAAAGGAGKGGGGLLGALGFGTSGIPFLGGLAGFGSIASLMGFDALHAITSAVGIGGSMIGAGLGAGFLGAGALGTGAVGMGTDMAGIGQAASDLQKYRTILSQIKAGTITAAQGQKELNAALAGMPAAARGAIVSLSHTVTTFITLFDKATGVAEAKGAAILGSLVKTGEAFLPVIGQFASQNMTIIMKALQPFEKWLDTSGHSGGLGIFTQLEKVFQSNLPTGMHALEQGFELLAKTIELVSPDLGHFVKWINTFLTRMNGATFGKWSKFVGDMVKDFEDWWPLLVQVGKTLADIFIPAVGLGGQFAKLLTTILRQIDQWLSSANMTAVLHQLFSAHLIEVITGIGGVLKAVLPFVEGFATAFLRVVTVGAELANMILLPLAHLLTDISEIPFATQVLGWAAAGLVLVAAFNKLRVYLSTLAVRFADFNVGTWLSGLGVSADEADVQLQQMATAVRTGVTQALQDAGIAAEGATTQFAAAGAAAAGAGEEAAVAAGEEGVAGFGSSLGSIIPGVGMAVGAIGGLALVFGSLFKSGPSAAQLTAKAVAQLNQQIAAMPKTTIAGLNIDFIKLSGYAAQAEKQLAKLSPTSSGAAVAAGRLQRLDQAMSQAAVASDRMNTQVSLLARTFGISTSQLRQFAQQAGVTLGKKLTIRSVEELRQELARSGTAAVRAANQIVPASASIAKSLGHAVATAIASDKRLVKTHEIELGLYAAISQKTGLRAMANLVNSLQGGLPKVEAVAKQYGVAIPQRYLTLMEEAHTKAGHISLQKLAAAMSAETDRVLHQGRASVVVPLTTVAQELKKLMSDGGKNSMAALETAISHEKGHISATTASNAVAAAKAIENHQKDFADGGKKLMDQLAAGIESGQTSVVQAAVKVAQAAVAAAQSTMSQGLSSASLGAVNSRLAAGSVRR